MSSPDYFRTCPEVFCTKSDAAATASFIHPSKRLGMVVPGHADQCARKRQSLHARPELLRQRHYPAGLLTL
jgi:hypothetical protein